MPIKAQPRSALAGRRTRPRAARVTKASEAAIVYLGRKIGLETRDNPNGRPMTHAMVAAHNVAAAIDAVASRVSLRGRTTETKRAVAASGPRTQASRDEPASASTAEAKVA